MSHQRITLRDNPTNQIPRRLLIALSVIFLCSCRTMTGERVTEIPPNRQNALADEGAAVPLATAVPVAVPPIVRREGPSPRVAFHLEDHSPIPSSDGWQNGASIRQIAHAESFPNPNQNPNPTVQNAAAVQDPTAPLSAVQEVGVGGRRQRRLGCPACGVENCQQHPCLPGSAIYLPPTKRPKDEFLCDGGDRFDQVMLGANGVYQGLDMEDTIASYRTKRGDIVVEASNQVCIYAPRFASVRKITGVTIHQQQLFASTMRENIAIASEGQNLKADHVRQRAHLDTGRRLLAANAFHSELGADVADRIVHLRAVQRQLLPYENLEFIRTGELGESEKPMLSKLIDSALAWTVGEGVQVSIKGVQLHDATSAKVVNEVRVYKMPEGKPHLRVAKLASTDNALPGDTVEFTIRFDNLGDQPLDDVAIVDNLTPRLELIEDSVKCSLDAKFTKNVNDGESLMIRWQLDQPLKVNEGGVIHFKCLVR